MGMKRAREVLSATAEVATSEAPPNDPTLPKHPPQPVPPPGRLLPRPPLPKLGPVTSLEGRFGALSASIAPAGACCFLL